MLAFCILRRKEMEKNSNDEFEMKDGKVELESLIRGLMQRFLGKALDYSRISGMSDRSFSQLSRNLKDDAYQLISFGTKMLEDAGYIKPTDGK
jgi:hypothetical protein